MLFSVVIPTHNRAGLLERTLNSVFSQEFTDYEVIVVDDGSTDGTVGYLELLADRITLIQQKNKGAGPARNAGVQSARGDYVAFLDSDDLWFSWTLGCFAELIRQHRRPALLGGSVLEFVDEAELAVVTGAPPRAKIFSDYLASHRSACTTGAGMSVVRRDVFVEAGGYTDRPINGEDHDLFLRLGSARGFIQVVAPATLAYRRHRGGVTASTQRSVAGNVYLLAQERRGAYPGGRARCIERHRIVTRHVRPVALTCLREGKRREAWALYRATLSWHVRLGRLRFLAAFPLIAALTPIQTPGGLYASGRGD